jgi:hypothetical protein
MWDPQRLEGHKAKEKHRGQSDIATQGEWTDGRKGGRVQKGGGRKERGVLKKHIPKSFLNPPRICKLMHSIQCSEKQDMWKEKKKEKSFACGGSDSLIWKRTRSFEFFLRTTRGKKEEKKNKTTREMRKGRGRWKMKRKSEDRKEEEDEKEDSGRQ